MGVGEILRVMDEKDGCSGDLIGKGNGKEG